MAEPVLEFAQDIDLKVVTPLFLGSATQSKAELRPPSIKGVMRFWHRATGPEGLETEAAFFGSSGKAASGQAPFLIRMDTAMLSGQTLDHVKAPLAYLGYGAINKGQSRPFIPPGTDIKLKLVFKPSASSDVKDGVLRSLRLMNYFGGLGARSRRGWGSVVFADDLPTDFDDLVSRLQDEVAALNIPQSREARYTSFSGESRVVALPAGKSWEEALSTVGQQMMMLRNPKTSPPDYPWAIRDVRMVSGYVKNGAAEQAPYRAMFGLPHNYFFGTTKDKVNIEGANKDFSRRASPLFIHVHLLQNGQYAVVLTFLPAPLLPAGQKISMGTQKQRTITVSLPTSWGAVEGFLDHIAGQPGAKEVLI